MDLELSRKASLVYFLEQAVKETNKTLYNYKKRTKSAIFHDTRRAIFEKNIKEQLRQFYEIYRPKTTNGPKDAAGRVGNECKWILDSNGDHNISEASCYYNKTNFWGDELRGWVSQAAKEIEGVLVELDYDSLRYAGDLDFQFNKLIANPQRWTLKKNKILKENFPNWVLRCSNGCGRPHIITQ